MIQITPQGVILSVFIQPKASKNEIVGLFNSELKIKVQSPPVDGKANETLVEYLSEVLRIAKSKIQIIKGETNRHKKVLIVGLNEAQIKSLIGLV